MSGLMRFETVDNFATVEFYVGGGEIVGDLLPVTVVAFAGGFRL